MWDDIPEGFSPLEEEEETDTFSDVPSGFSLTSAAPSWRGDIMSELDEDPETKLLAMQMLDTEGGGAATMESLVNRTAMIREKIPGWTLNDELNSGFYGPINRGYAQTRDLHPGAVAKYQEDIDKVRAGSNIIEGRTDQGYPGDPNWRGPGRVHVPENPREIYNFWTGERAGVTFTHEDSAEFAKKVQSGGPTSATTYSDIPEGFAVASQQQTEQQAPQYADIPEGFTTVKEDVIPLEPVAARPGGVEPGKKPFFATKEEEIASGGKGPNYPKEPLYVVGPKPKGMVEEGNLDLSNRPILHNPDGTISSERSFSIGEDGKEVLIPKIVNGKELSNEEAIAHYKKTGENMGKFKDVASADAYAERAHNRSMEQPAYPAKQSPEGLIDSVESGINAGKEVWEGAKRGLMSSSLGLGEMVNRYAYSPIVHGIREAIDYIAPDSDLAKGAKKIDDEFYKHTVQIPAAQREMLGKESAKAGAVGEVAHAVGTMAGDLPQIMLTGGLLPELKGGMQLVNELRHGAAAMTVPAMRAGADAAQEVKKNGGSEMEQFGAFVRGTSEMMFVGALPLATSSGAASVARRVAERSVKSIPLASAAVESGRMLDNAVSDIFGGEKRPFSLAENIKGTVPMALLGGVAGRSTAKSKFERTFGFSPEKFDRAEWMRARMDAEGIAKATPEKVMEWDAQWKKQQGEWPEEAPPPAPEAPIVNKLRDITEGKPVELYHGSKKAGLTELAPNTSFTASRQLAEKFAGKSGEVYSREMVVPADNPMRWTAEGLLKEIEAGKITAEEAEKTLTSRPSEIKPSRQALGIVADPRSQKGFQALHDEAKNIADYLNKAEHWGPWNSAVGNNVAANQKTLDNVMRQQKALKALVPNESERKGATMYREADGDMAKITGWGANVKNSEAKDAYRNAGALTAKGKELVDRVAQRYKELNMWLNLNGIDVAEREAYVTHMLHTSGVQPTTGAPLRSLSSYFRYAKPRTYDSFFQAFQAGEKPKTLDLVDILTAYELSAQRAVNNKKFVDRLKFGEARDGRKLVAPSRIKYEPEGQGYESLNAPGLEHSVVHPEIYKPLSRILGKSKIQDFLEERSDNPFLNIGKGVLQIGAETQKYAKGTIFSLSFFHQLTEGTHAVGHRVNPLKTKTKVIDLNDPEQYDAAVHGLMLRADKISQEQFMQGVGSDSYNLVTILARKFGGVAGKNVANFIDGYSHYLFEGYIPRLKMDTYRHILERNTGRFAKDLESGKVSMSEVKSLSADQANAAYGHLNYTKMARSPTVRQAMQLLLLAPDFFEARARFAAQAGKGAVGLLTGSKTGTEQLVALAWLGVGQYAAARILNYLDHGDSEWDPKHAFQVKTDLGGFLPDKRWVGLRSVPEDIHKAFVDFPQFMLNRASPYGRLAGESCVQNKLARRKD